MLTGAVSGLAAGLFGIGGGLIIVPALILVFTGQGVSEAQAIPVAIATSLATISFTSLTSAYTHWRQGNVSVDAAKQLIPGMMLGAVVGAWFVTKAPGQILMLLFAAFACWMGVRMWHTPTTQRAHLPRGLPIWGAGIGAASATFGIGGGSLTVPLLSRYGYDVRQSVGTSAACGLPIAWIASLTFVATSLHQSASLDQYINPIALLGLITMSPLFAIVGAKLVAKTRRDVLRKLFAIFLLSIAGRFIWTAFAQ